MFRKAFSPFQRTLVLVALALILPTLVLLVLEVSFALREHRREVEEQALSAAKQVVYQVDGRIESDLSAMRVLATARAAESRDWPAFVERARRVTALNPGWKTVLVNDRRRGVQLVDTLAANAVEVRPVDPRISAAMTGALPQIGGAIRSGPGCPCVPLSVALGGDDPGLVMTVLVDTQVFQAILQQQAAGFATTAIVDRDGLFVARNLNYADRVGLPSSTFVHKAIREGKRGVYPGRTLEGLVNYSGYETSSLSGWSGHVAVPAESLDAPVAWDNGLRLAGAAFALLVAIGLIGMALNELSTRRREEEGLRQAQKMEALGRLTGVVAHDFNNLLTVIVGALDMLSRRLQEPRDQKMADRALEAARRGARLTGQLLTFSRTQSLQVTAVEVRRLILGMEDLLKQSVGQRIELVFELGDAPIWASTDAGQLEFAILNLAVNARDAMPDGGRLTIGAEVKADRAEICVRDTGHGMDRHVADRALEPFFTTKPAGKGTGLGLAQVFGTVRQSGGSMKIESALGQGTAILLQLPLAEAPPSPAKPTKRSVRRADGERSILVVDDEDDVRAVIAESLVEAGYRVDQASNGELALAALRDRRYDLLMTDFAMPGLNGAELAARAREISPSIKVIIVSGYADTDAIAASQADAVLILKPVDATILTAAVAGALAA